MLDTTKPIRTVTSHGNVVILTICGPDAAFPLVGHIQGGNIIYQWSPNGHSSPNNKFVVNIEQTPVVISAYFQVWFNSTLGCLFGVMCNTQKDADIEREQRTAGGHTLIKEEYIEYSQEKNNREQQTNDKKTYGCKCTCHYGFAECICGRYGCGAA